MLNKFNTIWDYLRVSFIIIAILGLIAFTLKGYAHTVDIEGPSGESIQAEKDFINRENEKAYDRVNEGSRDEKDIERSSDYLRDNMV